VISAEPQGSAEHILRNTGIIHKHRRNFFGELKVNILGVSFLEQQTPLNCF